MDLPISTGFDWRKCIFCQKVLSKSKTTCPADSTRTDTGSGYFSLSKLVEGYLQAGKLDKSINVSSWDDGDGIEASLNRHRAVWHKQCRAVIHPTALLRIQKRGIEVEDPSCNKTAAISSESDFELDVSNSKVPRIMRSSTEACALSFSTVPQRNERICFLCDTVGEDNLRQVLTKEVDFQVKKCANIINDYLLLAKLVGPDLIAREAKYHPACLLNLYRSAARIQRASQENVQCESSSNSCPGLSFDSLAFAEIICLLEEARISDKTPPVFKLSELGSIYEKHLMKLGVVVSSKLNNTRLKDRLLEALPDLTAVCQGRDVLLTFKEHLGLALEQIKLNSDLGAVHLMHTAKLIRNDMFSSQFKFSDSLDIDNQEKSVPKSLLTFVKMLLEGPGQLDSNNIQAALSIAQLIVYNAVKRPRKMACSNKRQVMPIVKHSLHQETPLPIYLGMMLHASTRKKKLVDKCFNLGLCVSYDRVMQISNKVANTVCDHYNAEQLVCPPKLRSGIFTIAAGDNIDHNLSSNTAQSSFHGTAISLMQFPTSQCIGTDRGVCQYSESASDKLSGIKLPDIYTDVPPCILTTKDPIIPPRNFVLNDTNISTNFHWLNSVMEAVESTDDSSEEPVNISWAAYHANIASQFKGNVHLQPISSILPLFRHSANTPAMIRHTLNVVAAAIHHLNPRQVPVLTFDQPLYALAKQIQWQWPTTHGEDKFVILLGGLHIEMASLRMLGHWLDGSGWVESIAQAGVYSTGVAASCIHASHVKRTRYAHTVTVAALYICLQRSFKIHCEQFDVLPSINFLEWISQREKESTQFLYWHTVLQLELMVLSFVGSLREGHFEAYVDALQNLAPWFFLLDQTNYARWLSVHIRDMLTLKIVHPQIEAEFVAGHFTINKLGKHFSNISIDQAHEQLNAIIKGDGGAVGITENDAALDRWVIAGPEIIRIIHDFEDAKICADFTHHEQTLAYQKKFRLDVLNLLHVLLDDNPFDETVCDNLIALDSHIVADPSVNITVKTAREIGRRQFETFVAERLVGSVSILAPLSRNKVPLFTFKNLTKRNSLQKIKIRDLKTDCELFSRMYIACQTRNGDLDLFFKHENQSYPPSLSNGGNLRFGTKSDLLQCLNELSTSTIELSNLQVDTYIFDGAVIVQLLRPGLSKTFADYADNIFIPYIQSFLRKVERVDIVFDIYLSTSLKCATREKRGTGTRNIVRGNIKIPRNWQEFLRVDDNKTELFHFLADAISTMSINGKTLVVTYDARVKYVGKTPDIECLDPCSHEEADTRLILHTLNASQNNLKKIAIRTVDTDVVVLAISFFENLHVEELFIHFGVGKNVRLIPAHDVAHALGPVKCKALPIFHCLTGCDTVSSFAGKGKKSAWEAWNAYPVVTEAFVNLANLVGHDIDEATMSVLERFVIILYDRTSECTELDMARRHLFTKKSRAIESLPPTSDSFCQHVRRTVFQAVHCWGQCLQKQPHLPDPKEWGWMMDDRKWQPLWGTLPHVAEICSELVCCSCKKGCTSRCKCVKADLQCTALCHCDGGCIPTED